MKNSITLIIIIAFLFVTSKTWAQDKGQVRVSGSLTFGTRTALKDAGGQGLGLGLNAQIEYFIIKNMSAGIGYTYFFPTSKIYNGTKFKRNLSAANFDIKYYFLRKSVNLYGLVGVSCGFDKNTNSEFGSSKEEYFGYNIGFGVDYPINEKIYLNGQFKYNSALTQPTINLGVGYTF